MKSSTTKYLLYSTVCLIILLNIGCNEFSPKPSPPSPPVSVAQNMDITSIISELEKKPDWLFPADACPIDIMPSFEKETKYVTERCERIPQTCFEECKNKDGNACYSLALFLQKEISDKNEYSEALFLRSCEFGFSSGCTNVAAGRFEFENTDKSALDCIVNTFEETCKREDPWGCTMYATLLVFNGGSKKDLKKAQDVLETSCKHGDADPACLGAKELLKKIKQKNSIKK